MLPGLRRGGRARRHAPRRAQPRPARARRLASAPAPAAPSRRSSSRRSDAFHVASSPDRGGLLPRRSQDRTTCGWSRLAAISASRMKRWRKRSSSAAPASSSFSATSPLGFASLPARYTDPHGSLADERLHPKASKNRPGANRPRTSSYVQSRRHRMRPQPVYGVRPVLPLEELPDRALRLVAEHREREPVACVADGLVPGDVAPPVQLLLRVAGGLAAACARVSRRPRRPSRRARHAARPS